MTGVIHIVKDSMSTISYLFILSTSLNSKTYLLVLVDYRSFSIKALRKTNPKFFHLMTKRQLSQGLLSICLSPSISLSHSLILAL